MRIKKKGLALWLALFLGVSSLSGCGGGDDGMTQLSEKGAEILNSTEEDSDTDVEPLKQKTKLFLKNKKKQEIFIEAWNFLAIEERLLEEDLEDIDDF